MKQSDLFYLCTMEALVHNFSFKTFGTRDNYALLARKNHHLAMGFAVSREKSVRFQKKDCFECLSPHKIEA